MSIYRKMYYLEREIDGLRSVNNHLTERIAYARRQENLVTRPRVEMWLREAEDEELRFHKIRRYISQYERSCWARWFSWIRFKIVKEIDECLTAVRKLNREGDFDVVAHRLHPQAEQETTEVPLERGYLRNVGNHSTTEVPLERGYLRNVGNHSTTMAALMSAVAKQNLRTFSSMELITFTSGFCTYLGSGSYGEVYRGVLSDGVQIAVKVLKNNFEKIMKEQFMAEVITIGRTYHRNLVRLYGFCYDMNKKALVYEYMENGSLDNLLFDADSPMDWEKIPSIAIGIAKGLSYLHDECPERLVHYDIKPGNILLDSEFSPKVADFGLAKFYGRGVSHVPMSGFRGTPAYAAPEVWNRIPWPVTEKCDVYSYGVMLFELVGRRKNIRQKLGESQQWFPKQVWGKLKKGELEEVVVECGVPSECRESAKKMLKVALACIQQKPSDRPSMGRVVQILEGELEAMEPTNPFHNFVSSYSDTSGNGDPRLPGGIMERTNPFHNFVSRYSDTSGPGGIIEINGSFFSPVVEHYDIEIATLPGGLIEVNGSLFTPIVNKYGIKVANTF